MQLQDNEFGLVLFDLDGTLVDTAPDMVATLQEMQAVWQYKDVIGRSSADRLIVRRPAE